MDRFGFLTVRTGSSRLNRKCLLPFGGGNVLEHTIRRAAAFGYTPVVCTTELPEDDIVAEIAERENALCFRGSVQDKLARWQGACRTFSIPYFHTMDVDDPFFDGDLADRGLQKLLGGFDVIYPSSDVYGGSNGFSMTADIIDRVCAAKTSEDTEMMWYHVEKLPGLRHETLRIPEARVDNPSCRLTLDYEEDYWMLLTVLRLCGPLAPWTEIEELFVRNPDMAQINLFRNADWKAGQLAKKI